MYPTHRLVWSLLAAAGLLAACASGVSDQTTTSSGSGGAGSIPQACLEMCANVASADCASNDESACGSWCSDTRSFTQSSVPDCLSRFDELVKCATTAPVVCDLNGNANVNGCQIREDDYNLCLDNNSAANAASSSSSASGGGNAGACYAAQACNPMVPGSCGTAGEACDVTDDSGSVTFQCFPAPNDAQIGQPCDNGSGPFCAHGGACHQNQCVPYCCDQTDCVSGSCTPITDISSGCVAP